MNEAQLREQFVDVVNRAQKLGLTGADLSNLSCVQKIQTIDCAEGRSRRLLIWRRITCCVSLTLVALFLIQWPFSHPQLLSFLFGFEDITVSEAKLSSSLFRASPYLYELDLPEAYYTIT